MSQCPSHNYRDRMSCPGRVAKTHAVLQMSAEAAVIRKHAQRRLRAGTPGVLCGAGQVSVEHRLQRQASFKEGRDTRTRRDDIRLTLQLPRTM